jgi:hypothetical protein
MTALAFRLVTFIALGTAIGIAAGWQGWFRFLAGTIFLLQVLRPETAPATL